MNSQIEWSGSPDPLDPDNFWIDDDTGERVNATTGERTQPFLNPVFAGLCFGNHDPSPDNRERWDFDPAELRSNF